jgi:hypothetical protein
LNIERKATAVQKVWCSTVKVIPSAFVIAEKKERGNKQESRTERAGEGEGHAKKSKNIGIERRGRIFIHLNIQLLVAAR